MRTMKAIVTGMSAAALAMVMACGISTTSDAASATFDASKQTMTATTDGVEVMVSFDAIKVAKSGISWNAKAKWDIYTTKEATVDLSSLKTTKDMYVAVKDNTSALPKVYHIPACAPKLAGKYAVADKASKLDFTDNKVAIDTKTVILEYRTANTNTWTKYEATKFPMDMYEQQGATLNFRKQATALKITEPEEDPAEDAQYIMNEVSGNFASAEFKVKVTKMAAAPAATIDYDKGAFTIKKGTEYRFIDNAGEFVVPAGDDVVAGDFTPATEEKTTLVSIADITKDGIFEVRTAADKKVASKIAVYAYKGVATPKSSDVANGVSDTVTAKAKGLNLTYGEDKKGKPQVTFNSTNPDVSYLVYAVDPTVAENAKAKPIVTLLKSGEKKYKDVAVLQTKLADGADVYVVTASDKKTGVFRSKTLKIKVTYPKDEEGGEE